MSTGLDFQGVGSLRLVVVGAEVVQAAGQFHHRVRKARLPVAELVAHGPAALHPAQDMLHRDPGPVQAEVVLLVEGADFLAAPAFDRTAQRGPRRLVTGRTAVAQEQLAARKLPPGPFLGGHFFVMHPARSGRAQQLDCSPRHDHDVLHGVGFAPSAVMLALGGFGLRSAHRSFGAVDQEGQVRTGGQHLMQPRGRARGQMLLPAQGLLQERGQPLHPGADLRLAQAEEQ